MRYTQYFFVFAAVCVFMLAVPPRTVRLSLAPQPLPAPTPVSVKPPVKDVVAPQVVQVKLRPPAATASSSARSAPVSLPPPLPQVATPDIPIDLRSVVALKCLFKNPTGREVVAYGSGVMVSAEGYILTARHVVDMVYTHRITGGKQGFADYALDSCRVAVPPDSVKTPTAQAIRTLNPFTPVTEFAYVAQLSFAPPLPATGGMSEGEYDFADIALLRIASAVAGVLPPAFIASPVKITELPVEGDEITSFGFPSGVPSYGTNFYLQGSVGEMGDIVGGDRMFKNQPVGMTAAMETIGGRSGSPVFWRGYVIGVISSKQDYSRNTAISAVFAIARFAEEAGLAVFK